MRRATALVLVLVSVAGCAWLPGWWDRHATLTVRGPEPEARVTGSCEDAVAVSLHSNRLFGNRLGAKGF